MKMKFWVKGGFNQTPQTPSKFDPWLHMTKQSGAVPSEKGVADYKAKSI